MDKNNEYIKWSSFWKFAVGYATVVVLIISYVVANDSKRETDKDRIRTDLISFNSTLMFVINGMKSDISELRCNAFQRLAVLETKVK
jgi:hypothetical protein